MFRNNSGSIIIPPSKSSHFQWNIPNFKNIMSCDRIVTSPNFLHRNKSWHMVIKHENSSNRRSSDFGSTLGFGSMNASGKSYYALRLFDEQGIEMPASRKGNNTFISKAVIKTMDAIYIFKERGSYLFAMQNNVTSCDNTVTIVGQFADFSPPLVPTSGTASSFCKACECNGKRLLELSQDLKESYFNRLNCDFTIQVKEETFEVHKMILSARSPVFAAMFKTDMAESKSNNMNIPDCDPGAFHVFLRYLYSGEIEKMSIENVFHVFFIADKYNVDKLRAECVEYMKNNLCADKFCDIIELAANYKESELLKASKEYFRNYTEEIVSTVSWESFLKGNTTLVNELILLLKN